MEINTNELPFLVGSAAVLLIIYLFLYKKFIYSIVDPLFIWVLTTSFGSVLAIQVIPGLPDIIHFFGCQLSLWAGFVLAYNRPNANRLVDNELQATYTFSDQDLLRWFTYAAFFVYLFSNMIIAYSKGFALFSDTPTESKIANFQNGFGIFRKINWSIGTFVLTAFIYMYILKRRIIDLSFLIIVIFLGSLDGSKASFLRVALAAGVILYHPSFSGRKVALKTLKKYVPLFLGITMTIFFSVLLKENNGISEAGLAFIKRLLYTADSVLYYYTPVNIDYFDSYSFGDYLVRITNPILGFFRLQEYQEAPGNLMVENLSLPGSLPSVTVGPNAPFFIEGRIYFNFWVAFPYSMIIGYLYASTRIYFFSLQRSSAFYYIFVASFMQLAIALITDVNLAITQLFDLFFFVAPFYVVISLLLTRKVKISVFPFVVSRSKCRKN